jgi:galactose oxidase-like protein
VALIRPGSVTHGVNFEQRYVDLTFSAGAGFLSVTAPADGRVAPPGWYMLFLVNRAGVPSLASWIRLGV